MSWLKNKVSESLKNLPTSYRTYVYKDFSIVSKAKIEVLVREGNEGIPMHKIDDKLKIIDTLPVQVNPDSLSSNFGSQNFKFDSGIQAAGTGPESSKLASISAGQISSKDTEVLTHVPVEINNEVKIRLKFDLFDEYPVITMNGTLPIDFSLENEKYTILPILKKHIFGPKEPKHKYVYMRFIWGPMQFFGIPSGLNVDYKAFSPFGQPLKADVDLDLKLQSIPATGLNISKGFTGLGSEFLEKTDEAKHVQSLLVAKSVGESVYSAQLALGGNTALR